MKTINKNTKLTEAECEYIDSLFHDGVKICRKVKLFGAGHPQLPDLFGILMDDDEEKEFWQDHETTHARFIIYTSWGDLQSDVNLWRDSLVSAGSELLTMPIYNA